jgi:selenocysteine lyase/cysteine desulfurase
VRWAGLPARHEGGTPNLIGAVALAAACRTLTEIGWQAVHDHEQRLLEALRNGLAAFPGLSLLQLWPDDVPRVGIASFTLRGLHPDLVATALANEHGIGVRAGKFCAHTAVRCLTGGPDAIRASSPSTAAPRNTATASRLSRSARSSTASRTVGGTSISDK